MVCHSNRLCANCCKSIFPKLVIVMEMISATKQSVNTFVIFELVVMVFVTSVFM